MDERTRLRFQAHRLEICRKRGWIDDENRSIIPGDVKARTLRARALFGLELISGSDEVFVEAREALKGHGLAATESAESAQEILRQLSDREKCAVLRLVDHVLDLSVNAFMFELERFEFGELSLKHRDTDDDAQPLLWTEVLINAKDSDLEMFQEAHLWKEDFSLGAEIGRPGPKSSA